MITIEQERFINANPYYVYDRVDAIKKFGASGSSVFDCSGNGNHGTVVHEKPKVMNKEFWKSRGLPVPIICETFHEGSDS